MLRQFSKAHKEFLNWTNIIFIVFVSVNH